MLTKGPSKSVRTTRAGTNEASPALVPVLICLGIVVAFMASLGSPLVPLLGVEYGRPVSQAQWALTITMLTGAVTTPILGRLGDGPHRRTVLLAALAAMALGGALCALPGYNFALLLVGRSFQGIGLGLMPVAMTIARDHLPPERSGSTVALLSVTTTIGAGISFPLSGLAVNHLGIAPTFVLSALLSGIVFVLAYFVVPSSRHKPSRPLDLRGAVQLGVPLALFVVALSQAPTWGVRSPMLWASLAGSMVGMTTWVRYQLRTEYPLVDLRSLRHPQVRSAHVTATLVGVGTFLTFGMLVSFVQMPESTGYGMGQSIRAAGLLMMPLSVMSYVGSKLQERLRRAFDVGWAALFGCLVYLTAMVLFLFVHDSMAVMVAISALFGLGSGVLLALLPNQIISAIEPDELGSALGVSQVVRTVGGAVGSAISSAALAAATATGAIYPTESGFIHMTLMGIGLWAVLLVLTGPRSRPSAIVRP